MKLEAIKWEEVGKDTLISSDIIIKIEKEVCKARIRNILVKIIEKSSKTEN